MDAINNLPLHYKSKSGSSYYFVSDGVYRLSNHWGRAANCRWRLDSLPTDVKSNVKLGYASWEEFYPDNELEKLYYIVADYDNQSAQFYHKGSGANGALLRTSSETMKRLKQIRALFEETSWTKYIKGSDVAAIRREIIERLIATNDSFQQIRLDYL